MQKVELPINTPVPVLLSSLDGVLVPSQFGESRQQIRFTAADGRALYVPTHVGDQVKALGCRHVRLCKSQGAHRGPVTWKVEPGEQRDGTFVIPKEKPESAAAHSVNSGSPALTSIDSSVVQQVETSIPKSTTRRKRYIWDTGRELIDAQAALMKYAAEAHNGAVSRDDVRAYVTTIYIQCGRGVAAGLER